MCPPLNPSKSAPDKGWRTPKKAAKLTNFFKRLQIVFKKVNFLPKNHFFKCFVSFPATG